MSKRNLKIITGIMAALLVVSLAGGFYYWDKSRNLTLKKNIVEAHVNAQLVAKKRSIDQLSSQLATSEKQNEALAGRVEELNNLLNQKYAELWEMGARTTANQKTLRHAMQSQLAAAKSQAAQLTDQNQFLTNQNNNLSNQIVAMNEEMRTMVPRNALTADGFRVEAVKRNDKETAKAKKVHTLTISFHMPSELGLEGKKEVYLSLTDLQGNVVLTPLQTVTVAAAGKNKTIPVHAVKNIDFSNTLQQVAFTIEPADNIKPGIYRASVYTQDDYLGAVEFRFRDSFWFF